MRKLRLLVFLGIIAVSALFVHNGTTAAQAAYTYEEEAEILNILGLYDGIASERFDPDLDIPVNRETGIALLVKIFGKKDAALAMGDKEAAHYLAPYSDRKRISSWAEKYLAYAIKNNMVQGDTLNTLSPQKPMDGRSFATIILRNLGYTIDGAGWQTALETLSAKGGLASEKVQEFKKASLLKSDLAGLSYYALKTMNATGTSLIQTLVSENTVTRKKAEALGLIPDATSGKYHTATEAELVYYMIQNTLERVYDEVDISRFALSSSSQKVFDMVEKVVTENPQILYYNGCSYWSSGILQFNYSRDRETALAHHLALKQRVDEIIAEAIQPEMTDFEKELAIHDYIINNAQYDKENFDKGTLPPESYSAYGILMLGTGVCEGYAEAMKLIMDNLGIECMLVTGTADGRNHAWNIIKIDGEYYQLDITWDDPVMNDGSAQLSYGYFNITDAEMARDHDWEEERYPACNAVAYNYYQYHQIAVDSTEGFLLLLKNSLTSGTRSIFLKVLNYNSQTYDVESIIRTAVSEVPGFRYDTCNYTVSKQTGVIAIEFT